MTMIDEGRKPEGATERSPKAGEGAPSGVDGGGAKRFSVQRKMAVVARLLRGEPQREGRGGRLLTKFSLFWSALLRNSFMMRER